MKNTITYTSSLPKDLLEELNRFAEKLHVPKNQLIERSLRAYFQHLRKLEYILSFQRAAGDEEMLSLAEEGLEDYLDQLDEL